MIEFSELFRLFSSIVLVFIAAFFLSSVKFRRLIAWGAYFLGTALAVYGLIQKAGIDPFIWSYAPRGRVFSVCGHPNVLAGVLSFTLTVSMVLILLIRNIKDVAVILGGLLIQSTCFIFTYSRGGWICMICSLGVLCFLLVAVSRDVLRQRWRLLACSVAMIVGGVLIALSIGSSYDPFSADPSKAASMSVETRLRIWHGSLKMIADHPWIGVGPGRFSHAFPVYRPSDFLVVNPNLNVLHAHSEWLHLAAEYGVPFAVAVGAAVLWCFTRSIRSLSVRHSEDRLLQSAFIAATAGLWIQASADVTMRASFTAFLACSGIGLILGHQKWSEEWLSRVKGKARWVSFTMIGGILCFGIWETVLVPIQSEARLREGRSEKAQGHWESAIRKFNTAIRIDPANLDARYEKAVCLVELKEFDAALTEYREIEAFSPNYVQIHYNMGMIHVFKSEWSLAISRFQKADRVASLPLEFSLEEANSIIESERSNQEKDRLLFKMFVNCRFGDEARLRALKVETLIPDVMAFATVLQKQGNVLRAISAYEVVIGISPKHKVGLNNLAGLLFSNGKRIEAIGYYRVLHRTYPEDEISVVNLAGALATIREQKEAISILKDFLKTNDAPNAKVLLSKLESRVMPHP